ncbi:hypothetical protein WA026_009137 [Henosepilachna vigintioctopunctata]|uniref:Major facilitator superfamily (MFS) profile domain-containing protein n=1 Tax=Henosepilachna vigintioctopunctata TaxID=420089 RepID=A0AAW1UWM3_9CUCU
MIVSPIADNFHRKFLLTISHLGVSLTTIVLGIYFFLKDRGNDVSSISILPLICLMLYVSIYNVGIGPVLLTFLGELFPPRVKGLAVSCLVVYNWGTSFLVTLSFNKMSELMGLGPLLWMFATTGIIAVFFIRFCMIETKGKTFQEIQDELSQ